MSGSRAVAKADPLLDYNKWTTLLPNLARKYASNEPIPHIWINGFLNSDAAAKLANVFAVLASEGWTQYKHPNEDTLGLAEPKLFPAELTEITNELNSDAFVGWLSRLTGIPNLVSDPSFEGGGLHQSRRGGFLNIHTDFSHHHYYRNWRRRINLILYLNPVWPTDWGGAIELWDTTMHECVVKYPPLLNHVLIFNTDHRSLHGYPDPLRCPEDQPRNSLALYYYTVDGAPDSVTRSTTYRPRPSDGIVKSTMISLDNRLLDLYSRAKAHFGFSDVLASKILGFISRKK